MKKLLFMMLVVLTFGFMVGVTSCHSSLTGTDSQELSAFIGVSIADLCPYGRGQLAHSIDYYVNRCISYYGEEVPKNAIRMSGLCYHIDDYIFLSTHESGGDKIRHDIILGVQMGMALERIDECWNFLGKFYDYFDKNGWEYDKFGHYYNDAYIDTYIKGDNIAIIRPPTRRADGYYVVLVCFQPS